MASKEMTGYGYKTEDIDSKVQYFRDLESTPLLDQKQEIYLAQTIEKGRLAETILYLASHNHRANGTLHRVGEKSSARILENSALEFLTRLGVENYLKIATRECIAAINNDGQKKEETRTIVEEIKAIDPTSLKTRLNTQELGHW